MLYDPKLGTGKDHTVCILIFSRYETEGDKAKYTNDVVLSVGIWYYTFSVHYTIIIWMCDDYPMWCYVL